MIGRFSVVIQFKIFSVVVNLKYPSATGILV